MWHIKLGCGRGWSHRLGPVLEPRLPRPVLGGKLQHGNLATGTRSLPIYFQVGLGGLRVNGGWYCSFALTFFARAIARRLGSESHGSAVSAINSVISIRICWGLAIVPLVWLVARSRTWCLSLNSLYWYIVWISNYYLLLLSGLCSVATVELEIILEKQLVLKRSCWARLSIRWFKGQGNIAFSKWTFLTAHKLLWLSH